MQSHATGKTPRSDGTKSTGFSQAALAAFGLTDLSNDHLSDVLDNMSAMWPDDSSTLDSTDYMFTYANSSRPTGLIRNGNASACVRDPAKAQAGWACLAGPGGDTTTTPKNYSHWGELIGALGSHMVSKYGEDTAAEFFFEVRPGHQPTTLERRTHF